MTEQEKSTVHSVNHPAGNDSPGDSAMQSMHPADIAEMIHQCADVSEKQRSFAAIQDPSVQASVISELDPESTAQILHDMPPGDIAALTQELPADDVADILDRLPHERVPEILEALSTEESTDIAEVLKHPKQSAGRIMTTRYVALPEDSTAQDAVRAVQQATNAEMVFYVYVTDVAGRLTGVLSLRQLLLVPPATPLKLFMTPEPIAVTTLTDQEEVAKQVARYNFLAIPVVGEDDRTLVGIITVDDVVDVIREEDTEDMLTMSGTRIESSDMLMQTSSLEAAKRRLPWLFITLLGGMISGYILWLFRLTIQEVVAIVSFIPIIAGMGGNVGIQSSTLVIRGLATGEIELRDLWRLCRRESKVALLMGGACGGLIALIAIPWQGNPMLGVVVGVSMAIAFLLSTTMATAAPIVLKRLGWDPAVAAGPVVTTASDITGITAYLMIATAMLGFL